MFKNIPHERLMIFFAAVVQAVGFIISITIEDFSASFIPYAEKIVPVVNFSGSLIAFILVIFPQFRVTQSLVLFVQGIAMTLNTQLFLGPFLYSMGIVLLFCNGYLQENKKIKISIILSVWFISTFVILPQNLSQFIMIIAYSLFITFMYFYIYGAVFKSLLSLFPISAKHISSLNLPDFGTSLNLTEFGLSERQIKIVKHIAKTNSTSYKELADAAITSESTIKKDMLEIFKKLGVENSTSLKFFLSLYKIED